MRVTRLRISLITPSYNQAQFIERAIASVLCQTGPFDLEYLVFDGGSEDGTLEILHQYHDRLSWQSGRDQGQIDALNTGLRRATGEVVGWLNSDDVLAPGALAKVAEVFTKSAEKPRHSCRGWIGVGRAGLNAQAPNKTHAVPEPSMGEGTAEREAPAFMPGRTSPAFWSLLAPREAILPAVR